MDLPTITKFPRDGRGINLCLCVHCDGDVAGNWIEVKWVGNSSWSCDKLDCINRAILSCIWGATSKHIQSVKALPILIRCISCRGLGWLLPGETDHRCPGCKLLICGVCESTEGVKYRDSCTAYESKPLTYWDRILLDGQAPPNPNAPIPLCEPCAEDHFAFWLEMWDQYNSSRY